MLLIEVELLFLNFFLKISILKIKKPSSIFLQLTLSFYLLRRNIKVKRSFILEFFHIPDDICFSSNDTV
ncbi:hypothetical protein DQM68_06545 [Leptospira mayottensis]|uniref:Uncharacterized protein n=1 Tax=Leptospira mayottensis TaxID=1137606 RepID=A0ABN5NQH9_9LEPT|nr:hypothetical protein DQM68_06545 [Leptospira mayottensis]AXR64215.1 hypothetical protein DQM28_08250 [Leptospira mayottensis]AXR67927.1 hypothetical protein DPV73_07755 [Leptospira mayottensis]AZQ03172.1 hypothetical protein LEP1GSC190_15150 [Leptospira mayottensis 200901116]